jgi:predicted nucleotidyltransferase
MRPRTPYNVAMDRAFAFARLAELMPAARERFGVRDLAVFGSVARGEASDASDLDVLVDFVGKATFDGYMGLKLFLEDSLGVKVDLVTRAALKPRLRAWIEAEARRVA